MQAFLKKNGDIQSVHEGKKPFKCNICDTGFSYKGHLNVHFESVHNGKKPFKCNICDASFSRRDSLKRHNKSVHEEKRPFTCNICNGMFSHKGNLNTVRPCDARFLGKEKTRAAQIRATFVT